MEGKKLHVKEHLKKKSNIRASLALYLFFFFTVSYILFTIQKCNNVLYLSSHDVSQPESMILKHSRRRHMETIYSINIRT